MVTICEVFMINHDFLVDFFECFMKKGAPAKGYWSTGRSNSSFSGRFRKSYFLWCEVYGGGAIIKGVATNTPPTFGIEVVEVSLESILSGPIEKSVNNFCSKELKKSQTNRISFMTVRPRNNPAAPPTSDINANSGYTGSSL